MGKYRAIFTTLAGVMLASLHSGCEPRVANDAGPLRQEEWEYVTVFLIDMSGSFYDELERVAYPFFIQLNDKLFRDRMGSHDQVIVGQISATDRPLLWQGSPLGLRRSFPNAEAFRGFMVEHSNPNASRVHDSLADALHYVMNLRSVGPDTKLVVVVLSDMFDNIPDSVTSEQRIRAALAEFASRDGALMLYWVDQTLLPIWMQYLRESGIQQYDVQSEIVWNPGLLNFE